MVVHHVGEVIGGEPVGLDQNHVVQLRVIHRDISVQLVMEGGTAFLRVVLPDDEGHSRGKICLNLLFGKMQAVLVVGHDLLTVHHPLQGIQAFLGAEAVISLALVHQFFGILHVDAFLLAHTLDVGAYRSADIRSLIMNQPRALQGIVDDLLGAFHIAFLVRILDAKQVIAALMLGNQVGVKRGSEVSHMHPPRGARCVSRSDLVHD